MRKDIEKFWQKLFMEIVKGDRVQIRQPDSIFFGRLGTVVIVHDSGNAFVDIPGGVWRTHVFLLRDLWVIS